MCAQNIAYKEDAFQHSDVDGQLRRDEWPAGPEGERRLRLGLLLRWLCSALLCSSRAAASGN